MKSQIKRQLNPGDRAFVKRTQVVLVECFDNNTNNVNDARDRVYHEVTLAEYESEVPEASVPEVIAAVNA